jgi:S-adenosyl methyltransferase
VTDTSASEPPAGIDITKAQSARVWDYWLGGKDNYAVDREAGDQIRSVLPDIGDAARADRGFLVRAVRHLAGEAGIRQFLDIGTGLPTVNNTHQVAQSVAPDSRIVYVDNDPLVLTHARALLVGDTNGVTDYIDADVHEPGAILAAAGRTLDFSRPVALMMLGIVHHILDEDDPHAIVNELLDALPTGSYLAMAFIVKGVSETLDEAMKIWNANSPTPIVARSSDELASFFDGLELLEPGVVPCSQWRPEPVDLLDIDAHRDQASWRLCAVGRKR